MSRKSRSTRSRSLQAREFYADERDLREHLERAQQGVLGENSAQRKLHSTECNMEIQNLEQETSECALIDNESMDFKDDNYWKPINGQMKLREYTCVVNWRRRRIFTRNATQEVAMKLKKWNESWKNSTCSMIRNHEQWVHYGMKLENYKNDWSLLKTRKISKILTHRAVLAVPTFRTKLLPPRVPETPAANRERSEIHGRI